MNEIVEIKEDNSREPIPFSYSYKDNSVFQVSRTGALILEVWERTFDYKECVKVVQREFPYRKIRVDTIKRWMAKPSMLDARRAIVEKKAKAAGLKLEDLKAMAADVLAGERKMDNVQVQIWKELVALEGPRSNTFIADKQVIQFVQKNGEK